MAHWLRSCRTRLGQKPQCNITLRESKAAAQRLSQLLSGLTFRQLPTVLSPTTTLEQDNLFHSCRRIADSLAAPGYSTRPRFQLVPLAQAVEQHRALATATTSRSPGWTPVRRPSKLAAITSPPKITVAPLVPGLCYYDFTMPQGLYMADKPLTLSAHNSSLSGLNNPKTRKIKGSRTTNAGAFSFSSYFLILLRKIRKFLNKKTGAAVLGNP